MRQFAGLHTVHVDNPEDFARVVECFERGMDFADAMHLAGCGEEDTLVTFDRKLETAAGKIRAGSILRLRT